MQALGLCTCCSLCLEYPPTIFTHELWSSPHHSNSSLNLAITSSESSAIYCHIALYFFFACLLINYLACVYSLPLPPAPSPLDYKLLKDKGLLCPICYLHWVSASFYPLLANVRPAPSSEPPCWISLACFLASWLLDEFWPMGNCDGRLKGRDWVIRSHLYSVRSLAGCISISVILNWG